MIFAIVLVIVLPIENGNPHHISELLTPNAYGCCAVFGKPLIPDFNTNFVPTSPTSKFIDVAAATVDIVFGGPTSVPVTNTILSATLNFPSTCKPPDNILFA